MTEAEFKKIKGMWETIELIERLEKQFDNKELGFIPQTCPRTVMGLSMNIISVESSIPLTLEIINTLTKAKQGLKEKIKNIQVSFT